MSIFDTTSTQSGVPWSPLQQPTLQGVTQAQNLLQQGPYGGPYTDPINSMQQTGIQQGYNSAQNANAVGGQYWNQGNALVPGLQQSMQFNQQQLQGNNNPWMTNPAGYLNIAGNAANNPYLEGQISAALRDPARQLTEQTLPGIGQQYNALGQSASSRRGIAEGVAQRGYNDNASAISAQMRGNAWNTGLGIANQAAMGDQSGQQLAAQQLGAMGGQGLGYLGQSYNLGQQGATDQLQWGTQQQDLNNQQIQAQMNQYNAPWQTLQSYGSYVNPLAQNLQLQTNTNQGSLLQALGPVLGGIGGNAGNAVSDWLFGKPDANGSRSGGIIGGWNPFGSTP